MEATMRTRDQDFSFPAH